MKNKRRSFLKKSAIAGTGFFIVPRNVLGGNGYISPSDQLNIGAIGIGGKGQDIMGDWAKNERVIALCDVCLLYTSPSPRDKRQSRMPSSA